MAFIEKTDLLAYIDADELEEIIEGVDASLDRPIADALAQMKGRLSHRYDVDTIYAAPTNEDYATVKQAGVYLALYYLYSKVQARHIPEYRKECMEKAEYWLHDWATGQWNYNLPFKEQTDDNISKSGSGYTTSKPFLDSRF